MSNGTETQKLWTVRWGTMTALVWAQDEDNAELRVRHQAFKRSLTLADVRRQPVKVRGQVIVLREATDRDRKDFADSSIPVSA